MRSYPHQRFSTVRTRRAFYCRNRIRGAGTTLWHLILGTDLGVAVLDRADDDLEAPRDLASLLARRYRNVRSMSFQRRRWVFPIEKPC
jgi:hypothetical protein